MKRSDPRIVKTLRQIDNALLENIARHPFTKVTVDMICETAMINRSTFYKYYRDKFDLLDRFLSAALEEFSRRAKTDFVLASPAEIDDACYIHIFHDFIAFLYDEKATYLTLWNADIGRKIYEEMIEIVHDNILDKLNTSLPSTEYSLYRELYARLFASDMMTMVRWGFLNDREVDAEDIEKLMHSNMKNGLFFTFRQYI